MNDQCVGSRVYVQIYQFIVYDSRILRVFEGFVSFGNGKPFKFMYCTYLSLINFESSLDTLVWHKTLQVVFSSIFSY